jgi:hypothetical protein
MVAKTRIICDACGVEILKGRFCYRDYYLKLNPAFRPDVGTQSTTPLPIEGTMHFCDVSCLSRWALDNI